MLSHILCCNIESLTLSGSVFAKNFFKFTDHLHFSRCRLKSLQLSSPSFYWNFINNCLSLEQLNLRNCHLDSRFSHKFFRAIAKKNNLRKLTIDGCRCRSKPSSASSFFIGLNDRKRNLESFKSRNIDLSATCLEALSLRSGLQCAKLNFHKRMEYDQLFTALNRNILKTLAIENVRLSSVNTDRFIEGISKNTSLSSISLCNVKFDLWSDEDEDLGFSFQGRKASKEQRFWKCFSKLEHFCYDCNTLDEDESEEYYADIAPLFTENLKRLKFHTDWISDENVIMIFKAMGKAVALEKLSLHIPSDEHNLQHLAQSMLQNKIPLQELDLSDMYFPWAVPLRWMWEILSIPTLRRIDCQSADYVEDSDTGKLLGKALKKNSSLEYFFVYFEDDQEALKPFSKRLLKNYSLLEMPENVDHTIDFVLSRNSRLRRNCRR